jgi:hypoxanthine phosphoribosyltransferase
MDNIVVVNGKQFQKFIREEEIVSRVRELGLKISKEYTGRKPILISILNGSFLVTADLFKHIDTECEIAFVRFASYRGTSSTGKVATLMDLSIDITDRDILIVEDIVDSGRTIHHFLEILKNKKPKSVAVFTLLHKPDALLNPVQMDYIGFNIPDTFVIGYGLDFDGLGRNLRDIYRSL